MVASSIPIHASSTSTRAQSRAGGWIASFDFDGACTSTPSLPTIASTNESPSDSSTTTSTFTGPFCCNQQYSVTAITTSTGAIAERYAYTAYGQPTILNASGTPLSPQTSTLNSRYSYTGREWDATLGLHHFRARWMSPIAGRFLSRNPEGPYYAIAFQIPVLMRDESRSESNLDIRAIQFEMSGYYRRQRMGAAWCDLNKPIDDPYQILITNPTCSSVCTQQHEEQHAEDYLPCCKKARAAYQQPGADKNDVQRKWNDYLRGSRGWSECRAYQVSVICGNDLLNTKNCACEDSTCCDDIRKYIKASENQKKKFCDEDKGAPTCPF